MAKKDKSSLPFAKRLVLNKYILSLFGMENFEDLSIYVNKMENEGLTEERISRFHYAVVQALPLKGAQLNRDTLLAYDQNIVSHTLAIQGKRPEPIQWKYFQYLALLFTEIYLDRFMNSRDGFVKSLNEFLTGSYLTAGSRAGQPLSTPGFNSLLPDKEKIKPFTEDDLRKVAFWSATGSGKTLLMHMNIRQYLHHLTKSGRSRELNRILLVTPNEGLSRQHQEEFALSGIQADMFSKQGTSLFTGKAVEIIEITKLAEDAGDKTVALDAFESNNLVLVDEGHRGSSGAVWSSRRRKLAEKGFTFEYSATLGQAVSGNASLTQEYAKSILFDYSYRYFYNDGYGKDYRILNLADDSDETVRELYLTACLLTFYQQKTLFKDPRSKVKQFNIENPLWVFVGGSVNAVRTENRRKISDVVDILLFLANFSSIEEKTKVIQSISKAISGNTGLLDAKGHDIFKNMFPYLGDHMQTPEQVYDGIMRHIFNANGSASLHVEELKGTDGEIALRLGDNEPFGVINVGDAAKLCKLCEEHEILTVSEKNFSGSLFHNLNKENSTINILIGSKKFTEGWNSWRVSTMGLMNVGRSEGSQIIQLFGRGVRLKGYENTLKRHRALHEQGISQNQYLYRLETLNIFGIRADYMEQFKAYLEEEGVPVDDNIEKITIPVISNLGKQKLKTVRLKEGLNYKRNGEKPCLKLRGDINTVTLDYYPRIQAQIAKEIQINQEQAEKDNGYLTPEHIEFLDMDAIYFDLQIFKNERAWFNLNISKSRIKEILLDRSWYKILIPEEQLRFDGFEKVHLWQIIASNLMQKYCDRFYKASKDEWEAPYREYRELNASDPSFIKEYKILIDKSQQQIINQLETIKNRINSGQMPKADLTFGQGRALFFDRHLYQPLLYAESGDIQIKPVALNKGEKTFIEDLRSFYQQNADFFSDKELYLLRNMSKGRGIGFFEAGNFYPDFVMWVIDRNKQYVSFVDPKGIFNLQPGDPKIEFYKTIKTVEKQLGDKDVILNSFIISVTPYHIVRKWDGGMSEDDFAAKHILFQENQNYIKKLFGALVTH